MITINKNELVLDDGSLLKYQGDLVIYPNTSYGHGYGRPIAHLYPYQKDKGIVFFDIGWPESDGHAVHLCKGTIYKTNSFWYIDNNDDPELNALIFPSTDKHKAEFDFWRSYLATSAGTYKTRKEVRDAIARRFDNGDI
ncbi:MAG: hypothetical protein HQK77_15060 [Desulfobacterales bacterium]|nr:hypothetical protein [Desulfobacterales bacterium]